MTKLLPNLFVLMAIVIFFLYINPTFAGQIAAQQQQLATYNAALVAAAQFTQKENQLQAEEAEIPAASLARLNSYMPNGVDNIQLILDLNSLASRSAVTLSNFGIVDNATSTAATGSNIPTIGSESSTASLNLTVSATGSYSAFMTFLSAAEQSLRPMDVTSLTLSSGANDVNTYQITFVIYWLE